MHRQLTSWSFSRLKDYEICPYMVWLKSGEKRSMAHIDRTALDRGIMVHDACEKFILGQGDLIKEMAKFAEYFQALKTEYEEGKVEIEEEWAFNKHWQPTKWWAVDAVCRIKLDNFRHTGRDSENAPVAGVVTDYKTGKKFGNEISHTQQGQLYAIAAFLRYPSLEVVNVEFLYLDHGIKSKPKQYTRTQAIKFLASWQRRAQKLLDDREFRPKANKINCKYCPFGPQNGDNSCEWGVDG